MPVDPSLSADDQAMEWLIHLHSGRARSESWAAYDRWRAAAPEHEQAARAAETMWQALAQTQAAQDHRAAASPASARRRRPSPLFPAGALAAALACVVLLRSLPPAADYHTGVGERRVVVLPDGSRVTLNTDSALDVHYTDGERRVDLRHGEALFQVAKDPTRPFQVRTDDARARALGTVYDVRNLDGATQVAVVEGVVRVETRDGAAPVTLSAGQKLATGSAAASPGEVAAETAWQRGKLIVNNMPLHQVMAQLNRYRQGIIVVTGAVRDMPISAVLDLDDDAANDAALVSAFGLRVLRLPYLTLIRR